MMMKRTMTGILTAAVLAATPGMAIAQESTTTTDRPVQAREAETASGWFERIKARSLEAIDKRLATIEDLTAAINRSQTVGAAHADQLLGELASAEAGLSALAAEIRAAEDLETLRPLVPKIFEDYRIYAIVVPKVHLVLGSDGGVAIAERLGVAADSLDAVLDRLEENGIEVPGARDLLAEMLRLVESGSESAASVAGMVIDLIPADYPGSTETIRAAHGVLQSAGTDLRAAGENAREIVRLIKDAV